MKIVCTECEMYNSSHCEDCLVTALLHPPEGPVEIDDDLDPPLQALSGAGLIPVLKFRPRAPAAAPAPEEAGPAAGGGAG
jgi:hypothetical protein